MLFLESTSEIKKYDVVGINNQLLEDVLELTQLYEDTIINEYKALLNEDTQVLVEDSKAFLTKLKEQFLKIWNGFIAKLKAIVAKVRALIGKVADVVTVHKGIDDVIAKIGRACVSVGLENFERAEATLEEAKELFEKCKQGPTIKIKASGLQNIISPLKTLIDNLEKVSADLAHKIETFKDDTDASEQVQQWKKEANITTKLMSTTSMVSSYLANLKF